MYFVWSVISGMYMEPSGYTYSECYIGIWQNHELTFTLHIPVNAEDKYLFMQLQ